MKRDMHGTIQRHKARLVVQAFRQVLDIDYKETYSPVVSMISIRVFLALCCQLGYEIIQYDVDTAIQIGYIDEDITCGHLKDSKNSVV